MQYLYHKDLDGNFLHLEMRMTLAVGRLLAHQGAHSEKFQDTSFLPVP